jgi:hypothetical protein
MIRRSTLIVGGLTLFIGLALFKTKYAVMALEHQHTQVKKNIQETREAIHVLRAEWAHLNDPSRLQTLAQKYLDIAPVGGSQLVLFDDVAGKDGGYDRNALNNLIAEAARDQDIPNQDTD